MPIDFVHEPYRQMLLDLDGAIQRHIEQLNELVKVFEQRQDKPALREDVVLVMKTSRMLASNQSQMNSLLVSIFAIHYKKG